MHKRLFFPVHVLFLLLAAMVVDGHAASMTLNEWNAVSDTNFLNGGNSDSFFGRKRGNGGNWVELVVIDDHLDIRGWQLNWANDDGPPETGTLTFSNAGIWSDLRSGSIITVRHDDPATPPAPDPVGGVPTGPYGALASDTSYNPVGGDWWIHANAADATLITDGGPTVFNVDNDNWRMRILDDLNVVIQGFVGEGIGGTGWTAGGLGSDEVAKLEQNPSATPSNYRDGSSSTFGSPNVWSSGASTQDFSTLRAAVPEPSTGFLAFAAALCLGARLWHSRRS